LFTAEVAVGLLVADPDRLQDSRDFDRNPDTVQDAVLEDPADHQDVEGPFDGRDGAAGNLRSFLAVAGIHCPGVVAHTEDILEEVRTEHVGHSLVVLLVGLERSLPAVLDEEGTLNPRAVVGPVVSMPGSVLQVGIPGSRHAELIQVGNPVGEEADRVTPIAVDDRDKVNFLHCVELEARDAAVVVVAAAVDPSEVVVDLREVTVLILQIQVAVVKKRWPDVAERVRMSGRSVAGMPREGDHSVDAVVKVEQILHSKLEVSETAAVLVEWTQTVAKLVDHSWAAAAAAEGALGTLEVPSEVQPEPG
jgi:hypothetical protein